MNAKDNRAIPEAGVLHRSLCGFKSPVQGDEFVLPLNLSH